MSTGNYEILNGAILAMVQVRLKQEGYNSLEEAIAHSMVANKPFFAFLSAIVAIRATMLANKKDLNN